jgi:hypothetical protein
MVLVLLSHPVIEANSAPKPGAPCSKAGVEKKSQGTTLKCVRESGRLVWKRTSVPGKSKPTITTTTPTPSPSPSPTVEPSPSPSPTPRIKTITERWQETKSQALGAFERWSANLATGSPTTKIEYWFGPTISNQTQTESKRRLDNAVLQWERYVKVSRTRVFFDLGLYEDADRICQRVAARSTMRDFAGCMRQIKNSQDRILYHAAGWESEGGFTPTVDPKLSKNALVNHNYALEDELIFQSSSFLPRIEHEWFHQIQFDLTGNDYIRQYPCWFLEGSSEYFGTAAALGDKPESFLQHRSQAWGAFPQELSATYIRKWVEDASKTRLVAGSNADGCEALDRPQSIYTFGAILTEWMVGKIGIEKIVDILRETESIGWNAAFAKYMGARMSDSYEEMASYLFNELTIIEQTKSWLHLPRCPTYRSANFGVCFSNNILRGQ